MREADRLEERSHPVRGDKAMAARLYFIHPADGSQPKISDVIYSPDQAQAGTSNREFLGNFVANQLRTAFPNLQVYVLTDLPLIKRNP